MDSTHLSFSSSISRPRQVLFVGGAGSQIFRGTSSVLAFEEGVNKRRPFFTTADELLEEDYYDDLLPEKKRRLSPEQVHLLERSFEAENKLEPERKTELAKKLGLQPRQVAVWFQNRRARWKTKQLERDFDRLKSSYDALRSDHESLLKDNDRLRTQVASLMEQLREKETPVAGLLKGEQPHPFFEKEESPTEEDQLSPPSIPLSGTPRPGAEDRLSTGSARSSLINGDSAILQVDSCDESYLPIRGGAEDDAGSSDDGCSYLPVGFFAEAMNEDAWCIWSYK
ncbi:hypothetical protein HPP92_015308 [Vanilla planifolia]|uniref:Homeobox-leucine zipper protein n=1 Tax=Vanilla planifolia TaxID=51239 RepID=A0A835QHM1_VANPL|nr:hypothetical protein HPP92_015308 [Vanilla planifolia]